MCKNGGNEEMTECMNNRNALKGQVNSALGSAPGKECIPISNAPRSADKKSDTIAWGVTVGLNWTKLRI